MARQASKQEIRDAHRPSTRAGMSCYQRTTCLVTGDQSRPGYFVTCLTFHVATKICFLLGVLPCTMPLTNSYICDMVDGAFRAQFQRNAVFLA